MGAHSSRSIGTAVDFLVQQTHATWKNKDRVATQLCLDMTSAFDGVFPARLLRNMREMKILVKIVRWVSSFMSSRIITLYLPGYNTDAFFTHTGISQASLLLPMLFLFYNANLVVICNSLTLPASWTSFVDDITVLAFRKS